MSFYSAKAQDRKAVTATTIPALPTQIQTEPKDKAVDVAIRSQKMGIRWTQSEFERPQPDWYWQEIKKIAAKEYGGWVPNLDVSITPSYMIAGSRTTQSDFGSQTSQDKGSLSIEARIPLYSKKEMRSMYKEARSFLEEGSKLCAALETNLRTYQILQLALQNYGLMAQEEGSAMFDKFISTQKELVKLEADITATHRQLEAYIAPYSDKSDIRSWERTKETK